MITTENSANVIRSGVLFLLLAPLTIGSTIVSFQAMGEIKNSIEKASEVDEDSSFEQLKVVKDQLAIPCLKFRTSKPDSKLERDSKSEIDEIMGGDGNHRNVCNWAF